MSEKKYEEARIGAGLCRNCGCRKAKGGCTACTRCLREKALTQNDLRAWRRGRGLCPECGRARWRGRWGCQAHVARRREATRRYRKKQQGRASSDEDA